jgi:23S rRNA-/tRNA-specific pseudouridylate synthase
MLPNQGTRNTQQCHKLHPVLCRQVKKQYAALLAGRYEPGSSSSSQSVHSMHNDSSSGMTIIDLPVDSNPASTALWVLSHTPSLKFGWITTAELRPFTGRKHQLRQHMSALDHPILGDPLYNHFAQGAKLAGQGMCLWAQQLEFYQPLTGQLLQIGTEEPARFAKVRRQEARRYAEFAMQPQDV